MRFRVITDEQELNRLYQLQLERCETEDLAAICRIIAEQKKVMAISADTIKQSKLLINEGLNWSCRNLWLSQIGVKAGDRVVYHHYLGDRIGTIVRIEENPNKTHKVILTFGDGKKPKTLQVSAYSIRPVDGEWDCNAFIRRVRGKYGQDFS